MKISIISSSTPNQTTSKEAFDTFSGKVAGVCYMPSSFDELQTEANEKTMKRVSMTKNNGHHSVFDHCQMSLYLENIPKIIAMILNNEKMYTTSEKSARYTKMKLTETEQALYDKWLEIFKKEIADRYEKQFPEFFKGSKIEKLAQENARYLISVFTPTNMVYTVSYRQINYIYSFLKKELEIKTNSQFFKKLKEYIKEFIDELEASLPYIDAELMMDGKGRKLSLFKTTRIPVAEYYGDVYATSYKASFAFLAQAQRHRTLCYNFEMPKTEEYYIPPIIRQNKELSKQWLTDISSLKDNFPQGRLIKINEMGTLDNFILKMMERKCSYAQLEINEQTNLTLNKYVSYLKLSNHPRADELEKYTYGSRCTFPDYKCTSPCMFKDGVNETRLI